MARGVSNDVCDDSDDLVLSSKPSKLSFDGFKYINNSETVQRLVTVVRDMAEEIIKHRREVIIGLESSGTYVKVVDDTLSFQSEIMTMNEQ